MINSLQFRHFYGSEITAQSPQLAALRIAVFRAFPYLYEGTAEYEERYLQVYAAAKRSMLFAAFDGVKMIGATTCTPLADETAEVKAPFLAAGYHLPDIFYLGESILLPEYRGRGLGNRFFEEREKHARSFGNYRYTSFCAVIRPPQHPERPDDYRPLDGLWSKHGYRPVEELTTTFNWPDIGETVASDKLMQFWMKQL